MSSESSAVHAIHMEAFNYLDQLGFNASAVSTVKYRQQSTSPRHQRPETHGPGIEPNKCQIMPFL